MRRVGADDRATTSTSAGRGGATRCRLRHNGSMSIPARRKHAPRASGRTGANRMTVFKTAGAAVSVGSRVRVVWPSLREGITGTVVSVDHPRKLLEIRIDGERWEGAPMLVALDEVEPVP